MNRRQLTKSILVAMLFVLVLTGGYLIGTQLESSAYAPEKGAPVNELDLFEHIEYNGKTYIRKTDMTTLLVIGVDREDGTTPRTYRDGGQSDFLMLLVFDHDAKKIRQLQIDRDTITDVVMTSIMGKRVGTRATQICLSHGFGRNDTERCEYTVEAVENLLQGEKIELYLSVNLNSIDRLNDLLGGVTVTIEDDFTDKDPEMAPGTKLRLKGHQAEIFVRSRMSIGDGKNSSRMRRQRAFLNAAVSRLKERIHDDSNFLGTLYDTMGDNMTTNMSRGRLINEMNRAYHYEVLPVETFAGEHTIGNDGFVEFHADSQSIIDWILSALYKQPLQ